MAGMAKTFADALQEIEGSGDPEALVALFAEDASLSNLAHTLSGREGARSFWQIYLDQFAAIRSEFGRFIEDGEQAALVWTSQGSLKDGRPIAYSGVSIIDAAEGKVTRFETYYDSAAFLRDAAREA